MKKRLFPVLFVLPLLLITCSLPSLSISGKAGFPVIAPADYSTDQIYSDLAAELQTFVDGESVKDVALVRHLLNPLDEIERPLIHVGGTASYQLTAEDMNFATSTKPGYGITVPDLGAAFALLSISTSDVVAVSITISYVVEPAFTWPPGGFRRGLVRTGRLVFRPVLPASWVLPPPEIDLSGAAVVLKTAGKEDQALTLQKDTGGGVWYSSLDGKTLYSGTKVRITGTVNFPSGLLVPDDGFYVLHIKAVPEIGELSEVALTGSFRDDTVSFEVPVGIHSVNFNKVGIRFILNYPIEGLVYRVKIPALTLEEEVKTGSRGQKAEVVDYNKDLFVRADNNGSAPYFLNAAINIGPGDDPDFAGEYDAEMVVYDVAPGATLNITAKPEFIFDIERARLNLHKVLAGSRPDIYPIGKIPNDDIGLDINELLEPYDKFFKAENVVFNDINAAFFVRGYDDFLSGAKVKLWPSESPNYLNLDRDGSGYSFFNTSSAPLSPETLGTSFTGTLPAGLIRFDFDEIQKILRARPPNLFLHYDVRLPDNPVTLEFDEDTTLKIPYDFFLEIPLDFRIFADTPQGEYATIQFLDMAGTGDDVFNRKSVYEPLMSGAMDLQRLFVTVDYENNLGYNGLEADLVSMNGSTENFRQPLGMLSEGAGNLSTVLDAAAVPWPFVAGLEIRLPADKVEGVEKYAHFQIKRGGGIKAGLRISAEGSAEFHL